MSLSKVYYTYKDPASLGSITKLKRKTRKPSVDIKKWLASQDAYTLHAPVRKNFPRKQYYVSAPNELLQMEVGS